MNTRGVAVTAIVLSLAFVGAVVGPANAQGAVTLRDLLGTEFAAAFSATGAHDLDRPLSSSNAGASADIFFAAYYFVDELRDGGVLGPLHVSAFNRTRGRWSDAPPFAEDISGSVLDLRFVSQYVLVYLHWNPSAGETLVFDPTTLVLVGRVKGRYLHALNDDSLLFSGNMVHFAPTHQEHLVRFDPRRRRTVEFFPGSTESPVASSFRRTLVRSYARLPRPKRNQLEQANLGPVRDFDRDLGKIVEQANANRVAFTAHYANVGVGNRAPLPFLTTVVQCRRLPRSGWTCDERDIEETARRFALPLFRTADGGYAGNQVDELLRRLLQRP